VTLRMGEVAEAAGVNRETLRYYERRGLLARPDRSPGGHRLYDEQAVATLRVIKAAQRLGFTLDEVADLLETGKHQHGTRPDAGLRTRARVKLAEVQAKIDDLQVIAATLRAAVDAGCDDLVTCAGQPCCSIPFATIVVGDPDADRHLPRPPVAAVRPDRPRRDCLCCVLSDPAVAGRRNALGGGLGCGRGLDARHRHRHRARRPGRRRVVVDQSQASSVRLHGRWLRVRHLVIRGGFARLPVRCRA
jgi:MerR family mercuric resistance operon transcriptional regulator